MRIWSCLPIPKHFSRLYIVHLTNPQIFSTIYNALHGLTPFPTSSTLFLCLIHSFSISNILLPPTIGCYPCIEHLPVVNPYPSFISYLNYPFSRKHSLSSLSKANLLGQYLSIMQLSSITYHSWILYLLLCLLVISPSHWTNSSWGRTKFSSSHGTST